MEKRTGIHYAWVILIGVILIRGFAGGGINMTSGLFLSPVSNEIGVGVGSLSIYLSISSIVIVVWLPFAGKLINRYDIRFVAAVGAALQALSFAACGWMDHVLGWYVLAIPQAMGASILVSLLGPILIHRWFSKNAGLMMGIQMAFVGIFGTVLQPVTSKIIAADGWRAGYFAIGGVTFAVVVLTSLILLKNSPEKKGLSPYGADRISGEGGNGPGKKRGEDPIAISESVAIRSASFVLLLLFMIAITGVGVFAQHIPTYGALLGYGPEQIGASLAMASVGNAIGSILIGIVCDKIGSLKTCYGLLAIGFLSVLGFLLGGSNDLLFSIAAFLHGLVSSGIMVLSPILTLTFYGPGDYEKIFAKVSMGAPLASILLIPVYGFIYDIRQSYSTVLLGMLGLIILAVFCITWGWQKRCTQAGCPAWRGGSV